MSFSTKFFIYLDIVENTHHPYDEEKIFLHPPIKFLIWLKVANNQQRKIFWACLKNQFSKNKGGDTEGMLTCSAIYIKKRL